MRHHCCGEVLRSDTVTGNARAARHTCAAGDKNAGLTAAVQASYIPESTEVMAAVSVVGLGEAQYLQVTGTKETRATSCVRSAEAFYATSYTRGSRTATGRDTAARRARGDVVGPRAYVCVKR